MKSKCSFILKALTALVLAVVMLFGTVATTLAATVDTADTGAMVDIAETGDSGTCYYDHGGSTNYWLYFDGSKLSKKLSSYTYKYLLIGKSDYTSVYSLTRLANTELYYYNLTNNWTGTGVSTAFIGTNTSLSSGGTAYTTQWGKRATGAQYTSNYNFYGNTRTYFFYTTSDTTTLQQPQQISEGSDSYSTLKGTIYFKTQLAAANSNSFSNNTNTGIADLSLKAAYWNSKSPTLATATRTSTGSSRGNIKFGDAVDATATTLKYENLDSSKEFVGFYQGTSSTGGTMTALATSGTEKTVYSQTYTNAEQTLYYFARFRTKPLITLSENIAGTVKFGSSTVSGTAYIASTGTQAVTITAPTGYAVSSVSGANWARTANETTTTEWTGTISSAANATLTINYTEILDSSIALTAYTDGEASTDGGTIQVDSADVTSIPVGDVGVSTGVTAVSVVSGDDYAFTGWEFDGSNYNHIKYSFDNSTWNTPAAQNTIYGADQTTIYIKTDGTSGLTTADAIVKAMFVLKNRTVTTAALLATDGTGYSNSLGGLSPTLTGAGTYVTTPTPDSVTLTASEPAGYKFVGWYVSSSGSLTSAPLNSAVQGTSGIYTYTAGTRTLSFTMNTTCELNYYALYKKIYYVTAYNSYLEEDDEFIFRTSPPRTIKATNAQGTTTYNYSATDDIDLRGETDYGNGTGTDTNALDPGTKHIVNTNNATYYEGNLVQVLAGDTVELTYSTLSSSDVIRGVFFNNAIRYTTELEYDHLYSGRHYRGYYFDDDENENLGNCYDSDNHTPVAASDDDWGYTYNADTTLFADASYYQSETVEGVIPEVYVKDRIAAQRSGYKATVDQNTHTVTFVADQDYLNIDLELGAKRQILFSDADDTVVSSVHIDNFYSVGEHVDTHTSNTDTNDFRVVAKGNENQTTTITLANVKFYYYDAAKHCFTDDSGVKLENQNSPVELTGADATLVKNISAGTSISTNTGSNSSAFIYFTGTMPNTDVYIDLEVAVTFKMYIGGAVIADDLASKTYLGELATIRATYAPSTTRDAPTNAYYNGSSNMITRGTEVKYELVSWKTDTGSSKPWSTYYMFTGWYTGTSSGPDYANGFLTSDEIMYYTPTKNTYVYAVGTRDLYINGSRYITGENSDWVAANKKMEFDPDYYNSDTSKYGRYYWEITPAMLTAASGAYNKGGGYFTSSSVYYWNNNSNIGNSAFAFFDSATKDGDNKSYWKTLDTFTSSNSGVNEFGLVRPRDSDNAAYDATGFIVFSEALNQGYTAPLYIYAYPGANGFSVESTPVWPHIYVSNGFKNIDQATPSNVSISVNGTASGNNGSSSNSTQGKAYYAGSGWSPAQEGTVRDIQIREKNATVRITKTVASSSYKVSYFFCYNISKDKVKAYPASATTGVSNSYYADIDMVEDQKLYIVPIVERADADMTVIFDASQLDYSQWGKFISCYAWYSDDSKAYGAYPGQLMVPYDGGLTWKCNFPSTKPGDSTKKLVGITFANYVSGTDTWLGQTGVMGTTSGTATAETDTLTVTEANANLIRYYNNVGDHQYHKINFKAQTYDYREPIAFYSNSLAEGDANAIITFAVKKGNANLITWTYGDLTTENMKAHAKGGALYGTYPVDFEYLVDQKGNYVDFNGCSLPEKPAASFYVCAKGMVTYDNNVMLRQFWSANYYEKQNGCVPAAQNKPGWTSTITYDDAYGATSGVAMNYAVQWYVYDASGNYITNVLSTGYADKSSAEVTSLNTKFTAAGNDHPLADAISGARTQIAKKLDDLGYATSGRSIMICYDQPRYCYSTGGSPSVANGGDGFDAYRFEGQWLQQNQFETATVSAKVGISTANGFVMADTSSADYGSATISVDKSKLSHKSVKDKDDDTIELIGAKEVDGVWTGTVTITDGDKGGVILSADSTNFKGWYYYDADENLQLASSGASYAPGVSKDITYYAVYESKATYKLNYTGRRDADRSYSVSGGYLTSAEISNGNTVSASRTDFDTSFGGAAISIFKKNVNLSSHTPLDNTTKRVLQATLNSITDETFDLTYYYPNSSGGANAAHTTGTSGIAYNTVANLPSANSAAVEANAPSGKVFKGWYTAATGGKLLSVYPNFGMRIIKDTTVYAQYDNAAYSDDGSGWTVFIDENAITKELTSEKSGIFYNDTIIRVRNGADMTGDSMQIPEGAETGILLVRDGGTDLDTSTRTTAQLQRYIDNLTNGKTAKITAGGATVTKLCADRDGLTMYNRADFAISGDYSSTKGQHYTVYAYAKIDGSYYYSTDHVSGTYN